MKLETEQGGTREIVSVAELQAQLAALAPEGNSFAILSVEDEVYLQAAADIEGFLVERRDGSAASHLKAVRTMLDPTWELDRFALPEVTAMFTAYLADQPMPATVRWEPLAPPDQSPTNPARARKIFIAVLLLLLFLALAVPLLLWR
jgi:hypothetical protein